MRVAIYFAPPPDHQLTRAAAEWLGRDAYGRPVGPPTDFGALGATELAALTASPRRYGFHATLKAPFRLKAGSKLPDLAAALQAYCDRRPPLILHDLRVAAMNGFIALVPASPQPQIEALAESVVRTFEDFRAPLDEHERCRYRSAPLDAVEESNLLRWGYPYVLNRFRFHMTLTGEVADERRDAVINLLRNRLKDALQRPLAIDGLALFVEPSPGADFTVAYRSAFAA